ncbi:tRNA dihydrouridine synthase [sulfur-oxidizing endosymbiont of Gigantopelta aegis]|uniref:tRNA dihydrouridine synthase n=1 Tax=sulfur-oxidizing endosymbiont of Gigantopelta aegis TaxID=2794934 RepID=UPI0031B608CF
MAGITDRPFRQLCRRLGAAQVTSEMVTSKPELLNSLKTRTRLNHDGEAAPIAIQILGTEAQQMAAAAQYNMQHGADIIDINMGCPAKKVCHVSAGSALMKNESLVREILTAVVNAVPIPVTLKIRTGWDQVHKNALTIAQIAEQCGIQALTIHGRTRSCGYRGEAEYDTIKTVKQQVSIPISNFSISLCI